MVKDCPNCLNSADSSMEEPCFSCTRNPCTQVEDNWRPWKPDKIINIEVSKNG